MATVRVIYKRTITLPLTAEQAILLLKLHRALQRA